MSQRQLLITRADLSRYPYFYVHLRASLPQPVHRALAEQVRSGRPGPSSPEFSPAQDAMDLLVSTAERWALSAVVYRRDDLPFRPGEWREGMRFQWFVDYLYDHGEALLGTSLADDYENALAYGTRRARLVLGLDKVVHHLPAPCPTCNTVALFRHNGQEMVRCGFCKAEWNSHQYELLCRVLAAEAAEVEQS